MLQLGPWEIDEFGNIVDANEHIIKLVGTVLPNTMNDNELDVAKANRQLIVNAPSLNKIVGQVIDILENPYSNDNERITEIYDLLSNMYKAHIKTEEAE